MEKLVLLGDEAIAQAGIDAGISGVYAYPGTPSTEITEYIQSSKQAQHKNIKCSWSVNEKTAYETALGMSYAGKRAMVCMKHVGLNVAADPFINSAITGANGGLLVVCADDPSMHSSQNEQDSRYYGKFAMIPILEPSNQQVAYDMVFYGFEISEKNEIPVMLRITTRLAHSRSGVMRKDELQQNHLHLPKDPRQYVLLPAIARRQYKKLLNKQNAFLAESENSSFNKYFDRKDKSLGIIAAGISINYLMENFNNGSLIHPVLKIGQYPLPLTLIRKIYDECDKVLVLEDGYPFIEEMMRGILTDNSKINGRLDSTIPRDGELTPDIVAKGLGIENNILNIIPQIVVNRPPTLCDGCPHIDAFNALKEVMAEYSEGRIFSDIGCYTLGALPPFETINSCVDMGASITMAKGAADAGLIPAVAVIGDSTFSHSGITALLDAVNDNSPITVVILDNKTTAMTGGQESAVTDRIEDICFGLGVCKEHVHILNPMKKHHEKNVKVFRDEINYNGISVIIPRRECIQTSNRTVKKKKMESI